MARLDWARYGKALLAGEGRGRWLRRLGGEEASSRGSRLGLC